METYRGIPSAPLTPGELSGGFIQSESYIILSNSPIHNKKKRATPPRKLVTAWSGTIFEEGELRPETTHKEYLSVRGKVHGRYSGGLEHYNLDMIISVGVNAYATLIARSYAPPSVIIIMSL
ncbi:MAG: virulence RhuM family protein [Betaproteobacteria bacterium]|nr:virulence RhuM family protein [Betaproteobacteria bacterium]